MSMNIYFEEVSLIQTPTDISYKIINSTDPFMSYMDYYISCVSGEDGSFEMIEAHALKIRKYRKQNPIVRWEIS